VLREGELSSHVRLRRAKLRARICCILAMPRGFTDKPRRADRSAFILASRGNPMKLYFSPGACSLAPHIVLLEAGLPFTTERVDLRTKVMASGADFRAINPKGYVPALELKDGAVLTEVPTIIQFLADMAPEAKLLPASGIERYRVIEWLNFIATELHKGFATLFTPTATEDMKSAARANLANRYRYVERALEGREYLAGAEFSAADIFLFTANSWTGYVQVDLSDFPRLLAFQARIAARPAVQQALRNEGLVK
jgi:glutathione S-transferase